MDWILLMQYFYVTARGMYKTLLDGLERGVIEDVVDISCGSEKKAHPICVPPKSGEKSHDIRRHEGLSDKKIKIKN